LTLDGSVDPACLALDPAAGCSLASAIAGAMLVTVLRPLGVAGCVDVFGVGGSLGAFGVADALEALEVRLRPLNRVLRSATKAWFSNETVCR
jgi:hypothetical protein